MASDPVRDDLMRQADDAYQNGRLIEASHKYEELVARYSNDPKGFHHLGRTYAQRGRYRQAAEAFKKAIELGAEIGDIYYELAHSYSKVEQYGLAIVHAGKALELEPENAQYHNFAGQLSSDNKEYSKAITHYRSALEKNDKLVDTYLRLAEALKNLGRPEEALAELVKVVRVNASTMHQEEWAEWESHLKDLKEIAAGQVSKVLNELPESYPLWFHWGRILLEGGENKPGIEATLQALGLTSGDKGTSTAATQGHEPRETKEYVFISALSTLTFYARESADLALLDKQVTPHIERFDRFDAYATWAAHLLENKRFAAALDLMTKFFRRPHQIDEVSVMLQQALQSIQWGMEKEDQEQLTDKLNTIFEELDDEIADYAWAEYLLYILQNYSNAERFLRHAIGRNETFSYAYGLLAITCAGQGKHDDAYDALIRQLELCAEQGIDAIPIALQEIVPVLRRDGVKKTQRIGDLITRLDREALFLEWAKVLLELHEPSQALEQLQASTKHGMEIPDSFLTDVLFGETSTKKHPTELLVDKWASFLQGTTHREGLIQLARILKENDKKRARFCVRMAIEGLDQADPLWLDAGEAFVALDSPEEAVPCYHRHLTECPESYRIASWRQNPYQAWTNALMLTDKMRGGSGHIAALLGGIESWAEDAQFKDKVPEINWKNIRKRRAARRLSIDKLVEAVERNVDEVEICIGTAEVLFDNREYGAAIQVLRHAAGLDHRNIQTANLMGWSLAEIGKRFEALSEFRLATDLDPTFWYAHNGMARTTTFLNDITKAKESYELAASLVGDDHANKSIIYGYWSWALIEAGELDEALEKAERSREEAERSHGQSDDMWPSFRLGHVYGEMYRYEDAVKHYEKAIEQEDHPYPRHNLASLEQDRCQYKTARQLWHDACTVYHKRLAEAISTGDVEYLFNYGNVHARTLRNRSVGEMLYQIGLELKADHSGILTNLGRLYMEQSKDTRAPGSKNLHSWLSGVASWGTKTSNQKEDLQGLKSRSHLEWLAKQCWKKAESILLERKEQDGDMETLIELGNLYLDMDDDERAGSYFRQALEKRKRDFQAHAGLGEVFRRSDRGTLAIHHLRQAANEVPKDLDIKIKLARACLEDGKLDVAETQFRDILGHSEDHFFARVGLGEVYIAIAEARRKMEDTEAATEFWRRAQGELTRAVETADSSEGPERVSDRELASVHYQLGYCQVNQYETAPKLRRRSLLRDALNEFKTCCRLDPAHYRAERAHNKLREKVRLWPPDRPTQVIGPIIVAIIALGLLATAQWTKFYGWDETGTPAGFRFTEETLAAIPSLSRALPRDSNDFKELADKLKPAFGKTFADEETLVANVESLAGAEWAGQYARALARYAFVPPGPPRRQYLSEDYWVLLSLGAVVFLIAGLYLPSLISLKVGPLMLEKSTAVQVGAREALGVTVERMTRMR